MMARVRRSIVSLLLFTSGACSYPVNPELARFDPKVGYRYEQLVPRDGDENDEEVLVVLTFSGGGTRAAAFAYGVLERLRQTTIYGGRKTLLDEVDVISSVSGGSFASAYYGLFGPEKFFHAFRPAVLERKIERDLILRVLAPWNWPRLLSPSFGRGDLADEYYDQHIFEGRTYADMPRTRPFIILNATDIGEGAQFSFIQEHFDRLCSDLSGVHVSRAVTASSAFPVAFTPLTLKNYPKASCGYRPPRWVELAHQHDFERVPRRYDRAANWKSYEDADRRPYVHLSDGGLADNIGLRGPEFAITTGDSAWSVLPKVNLGQVKRLVVIVVDAKPESDSALDRRARPPGFIAVLNAAATNPMENYSADTIELLRDRFREWDAAARAFEARRERTTAECDALAADTCGTGGDRHRCIEERRKRCYASFVPGESDKPPHPELYRIHVRFAAIKEPELRRELERIGTRLQLAAPEVDLVIDAARTLLDQSEEFQRLVDDLLESTPPTAR
jgi:NTE family protein